MMTALLLEKPSERLSFIMVFPSHYFLLKAIMIGNFNIWIEVPYAARQIITNMDCYTSLRQKDAQNRHVWSVGGSVWLTLYLLMF